jgi:glycerophosphoryl diester phosphodiesterase
MRDVWVVAHRGASGHAPENTMAAFRRAVEMGAQFIETDIHLTRDAELVAIHDTTLERTTNGSGQVKNFTLADLRALDAGSWFAPEFAGERIPTFDEIVTFAREADVVFYLELKADAPWGAEHALSAALRRAGESSRMAVLSFVPAALTTLRKLDPVVMTGLLFDKPMPDCVGRAIVSGARQLAPRGDLVTPQLVEEAHNAELQVVTWTVNDPAEMRAMMDAGVDGIMTNYPDQLRDLLRSVS